MKKQIIFLLACFTLTTLAPIAARASVAVSQQDMRAGMAEKMRENPKNVFKNDKKTTKRLNKIAKRIERKALKHGMQVDFSDPVDKWLWFGIFGLGIAIVMSFFDLGIGGLIAFLAVVCLVIWVVKRSA